MKKLLVLFLALTLCLALAACGGDTTCTEHSDADVDGKCDNCGAAVEPDDDGGTTATGAVELVKNGSATFQIVSTSETSSLIGRPLTNFLKNLNDCIADGNVAAVYESADAKDVEIVLGSVSTRGDDFNEDNANPYAYGYEGWAVKIVGNKILVLGGSAGAYKDALEYLEETVFGINDATVSIDNVTMTAEQAKTDAQTDFDVTVTVDGAPLNDFVFAVNAGDKTATSAIEKIRTQLFKKTGAYLKTVTADNLADGQKAVWIETL